MSGRQLKFRISSIAAIGLLVLTALFVRAYILKRSNVYYLTESMLSSPKLVQQPSYFHSYPDSNRYASNDIWRPPPNDVDLRQGLTTVAAVDNGHRILLLVKTSAETIWTRMPLHFLTTFTKLPNFAIYSDAADSIAGYEVYDVLANVSSDVMNSDTFISYRQARMMRDQHSYTIPSTDGLNRLDRFKPLRMLLHAYQNLEKHDWYILLDDDLALIPENLVDFVSSYNPDTELYTGFPLAAYSSIFAGEKAGIVISRALMKKAFGIPEAVELVQQYTETSSKKESGDYLVSKYLNEVVGHSMDYELADSKFQHEPIWAMYFNQFNWCKPVIGVGQSHPRHLEVLWEYQTVKTKDKKKIRYVDLYHDFIKPYLPLQAYVNWDNFAQSEEYSWKTDGMPSSIDPDKPYADFSKCLTVCENEPNCLMVRYDPYALQCTTSTSVALGRAINQADYQRMDKETNQLRQSTNVFDRAYRVPGEEITSFWFVDRVRLMRTQIRCDRIYRDARKEGMINGIYDQIEGWWLRAKEKYSDNNPTHL